MMMFGFEPMMLACNDASCAIALAVKSQHRLAIRMAALTKVFLIILNLSLSLRECYEFLILWPDLSTRLVGEWKNPQSVTCGRGKNSRAREAGACSYFF